MRLEDWQKFIESQFLEDGGAKQPDREPDAETAAEEKPAKPDAAPVIMNTAERKTETKAENRTAADEAQIALSYVPVTVKPIMDAASHEAKPLYAPLDAEEIQALTLPFAEDETADLPVYFGTPDAAGEEKNELPLHQTLDFDAEIPEFASYLPAYRVNKLAPDAAPVADVEIAPKIEAQTEAPSVAALRMAAAQVEQNGAHHVAVHENRLPAAFDAGEPAEDAPIRLERNPRSRARHARNVQPQNVASGLSAADMWPSVPRHAQTLLALERLEEKEIAQSSYKRPFAEGRLELIERLLDPILSLEDTARLLNVCPTTVRRYTNRGILTHYRKETERGGDSNRQTERETRQRRFRLSDILAFLETQQSAINTEGETERAPRRAADKSAPVSS